VKLKAVFMTVMWDLKQVASARPWM
jgi:hypothetical protein